MLLDVNDILGKPYKAHARGPKAFDCYGLVIEVEKRLGHTMPDLYTKLSMSESTEYDIHDVDFSTEATGLEKTDKPNFGDVVIFFDNKGRIFHTGVYLKNDDFIHCNKEGVNIMKLQHYGSKWEVYKWK